MVVPNTIKAKEETMRKSRRLIFLPTMGERRKARRPTGAVANHAQLAV